jgi:mono/diheme cytochrome c family protein
MMMRSLLILLLGLLAAAAGCSRGQPRESRNVQVIPDMEFQKKYISQSYAPFFIDGRAMRTPPEGTIARGSLRAEQVFYEGKVDTTFVTHSPLDPTVELMERGRERYNIYCAPCHDRTGSGQGIVVNYGLVPPTNFHQERAWEFTDGYIYDVISNGVRNMPGYRTQIPVADRWAIVSYVRALQRAHNANLSEVPASERDNLE